MKMLTDGLTDGQMDDGVIGILITHELKSYIS